MEKQYIGIIMAGLNKSNSSINFHYRQQVIDRIFELYTPPDISKIFLPGLIKQHEIELIESAILLFGSWENAIYKSGLSPEIVAKFQTSSKEFWTPEAIVEQLQILHNHGFDLSARFIKHIYPELYSAATKKINFGSWSSALEHAEIDHDYLTSEVHHFWNLNRIFGIMTDYLEAYGNLQPEFIRSINPTLYSSAHRYYPIWSKLLDAIGLNMGKNFLNFMLESFRSYIVLDLLKDILEFSGLKFSVVQTGPNITSENNSASVLELDLTKLLDVQEFYIELDEDKTKTLVLAAYRSWGYHAENEIRSHLSRWPRVICYYSIGEPRLWFGDKVRFWNINQFFPELKVKGRDEMISGLGLVLRGGIPDKYQQQYNIVMKEIKKQLKDKKNQEKS